MKNIDIPQQIFMGKTYRLYPGRNYFTSHRYTLHFMVWQHYNGKVPEGYHVHHKDENTFNNDISNLELKKSKDHLSDHIKARIKNNPEWLRKFQEAGILAAKEWHKSKAGNQWHIQQALKQGFGKQEYGNGICGICSKEFKKNTAHQIFCGPNCKAKDFRKRHKP